MHRRFKNKDVKSAKAVQISPSTMPHATSYYPSFFVYCIDYNSVSGELGFDLKTWTRTG
jgi:hypothetical protein